MNIGIDLGSTYSTVSKYNPSTGPVAMTMKQGDPASIPSEVAFNDLMGQYTCGTSAKGMAGQRGVRLFRAFKMLLVESNKNILAEHGYTGNNTPRAITTKYSMSFNVMGHPSCGPFASPVRRSVPEISISSLFLHKKNRWYCTKETPVSTGAPVGFRWGYSAGIPARPCSPGCSYGRRRR